MWLGLRPWLHNHYKNKNTMLDCLDNFIEVPSCGAADPESGFWITDLEGISLQFIMDLTDQEKKTFLQVWNTIKKRAALKLGPLLMSEFRKCWKVKSMDCVEALFCDQKGEFIQGLLYFYGAELMNECLYGTTWNRWNQTTEEAKEKQEYYIREFATALQIFVSTRDIDPCVDPECFECGTAHGGMTTVVQMP